MIFFAPAKINIGLFITGKRSDGFHDLQSLMYPTGLCDILEIQVLPHSSPSLEFSISGLEFSEDAGNNLCERAYHLMCREASLPPLALHLHKQIPVGAGLGGGSSDAIGTLMALNRLLKAPLPPGRMHELAARLGSDCPFFLHNQPMMMEGRGEILSRTSTDLRSFFLAILFPGLHISTAEAYSGVSPSIPEIHLRELLKEPPGLWKQKVANDFEEGVFSKHPELASLKAGLYRSGAIFASMSGSGSSLFGIFPRVPELPDSLEKYLVWKGQMLY